MAQLRLRIRTRHYSYRTECTYVDWVRRFLEYAARQQGVPHPRVASAVVRDYLTHLAVHQRVAASTQNQAFLRDSVPVSRGVGREHRECLHCGEIHTHVVKEFRTPARSPLDFIHARTPGKGFGHVQ